MVSGVTNGELMSVLLVVVLQLGLVQKWLHCDVLLHAGDVLGWFTQLVQRAFKCGNMQHNRLTRDKELNNVIHGSHFCFSVITYR